ncbi:Amino-acid carrier protein AlsT [Anaplasma phagocytophilum]|uniref:Amino-acid carrier protein AlsT n=3 Tax=Anaplasma phagocytophilum TaxID=948 RepID=A0A098EG94_ANAPH|nr:alanine:cation symporter family protein [Anaplasma phagocytophilum]ANC34055.1 transporter [Anaplasma phagocytophilum str. Norway variant2]CEG20795.1 Sodium:alanine symporter family protein [Anaplasma phagocytophilum]SBO14166.1 Amino-acid carrier protein AlsT [Anaplasma phagocytophilum]SBO31137.1 Amino-acid carrier protein AlsT [Anaplasma phagocytophilum]SBO31329.1 Amino-acid carrier protein AlsT [Anaplasma phagocytophilum]
MYFLKLFLAFPAVFLLLFSGFRLSFSSRWLQLRSFTDAISCLLKNRGAEFSSLAALCAIVGGNLGVGNLSGTAVALKAGGPGFIVWMVFIIILTSIIKYATCYISIRTREERNGRTFGGPVVYSQHAFKTKWASLAVAIITMVCAVTVGNLVQVNSLSISMHLIGQSPLSAGIVMAIALFIVTNLGSLGRVVSRVVPAMTIFYIVLAGLTLGKFGSNIIPSLKLILESALSLSSLRDGAILALVAETFTIIQVGALRGIFATDIGLGLEGTVHSMVVSKNVVDSNFATQQSLVSIISPFIVALVTFITTLVLLTTGVWTDLSLESTNMCFAAFTSAFGKHYTEYALIALVFCFSLTTILTWFICSKEVLAYVSHNNRFMEKCWTALFFFIIPLGSLGGVSLLWDIADISISISIIINTLGILLLLNRYKKEMFSALSKDSSKE